MYEQTQQTQKFEISINPNSIITIIVIVLGFLLVYQSLNIIILVFFAFIFSSALGPILDFLISKRIRKSWSIGIIFIALILSSIVLGFIVSTPLIQEFNLLLKDTPGIVQRLIENLIQTFPELSKQLNLQQIYPQLATQGSETALQILQGLLSGISGIVGSVANILLTFVLTGFFLSERGRDSREKITIMKYLGEKAGLFRSIYQKVQAKIGAWFRGQLLMCLITGIVSFLGFTILGFQFAIPIAMISAFLEAIPMIGASFMGILGGAIAFGLTGNWIGALIYIGVMALWQSISSVTVFPKVMEKTVGLNPIVTLIAVLIALQIPNWGISGILITLPLVATFQIIFEEYLSRK